MAVLFNAGDHEPVIPLIDVVGNGVKVPPEQIAATGLNVGVIWLVIVTVVVQVEVVHPLLTVHVIVDIPGLNRPLALFPDPLLVVAPVIW